MIGLNFLQKVWRGRRRGHEIDPDEIFLDASNLPEFDEYQFEGRIERPIKKRTIVTFGVCCALIGLIFLGKIFDLQIFDGEIYAAQAQANRLEHTLVFAERGVIYDRRGERVAWNELRDGAAFADRKYYEEGLGLLLGYVTYPQADRSGIYYTEEMHGLDGIEKLKDRELVGVNGRKIVELDALSQLQSESVFDRPQDGHTIVLTIDAELQAKLFEFIEARAKESGFRGGAAVIMNVHNGDLLALTSYPEYRGELLASGSATSVTAYTEDLAKPFLNRAVSGLYTPGSIIKPFIAVGALEEGVISPTKEILSTGSLTLENPYNPSLSTTFKDWKAHGYVDLRQALAVSSNVYFFEIGGGFGSQPGLGITRIEKYVRKFGFGSPTSLSIAPEPEGTIPSPAWKEELFEDEWRLGDTYNTAIGQYGFQVTPLQTVRAIAAIANGGVLYNPSLFLDDAVVRTSTGVDPGNLAIVREGMRQAVTGGTAAGLSLQEVAIAAKTGTAELGSTKSYVNSWAVGFFPYDDPEYAFAILLEAGPRENLMGGVSVMRRLFDWMVIERPEYLQTDDPR
jgi:penicillin-binding protein 2